MGSVVALVVPLLGCAPTSQESYTYPGCEARTSGSGCENDSTYACALAAIAARHGACVADEDCTLVSTELPRSCYGTCPWAVAHAGADVFAAEVAAEDARYCATDAFCGTPDCESGVARCIGGRCATSRR